MIYGSNDREGVSECGMMRTVFDADAAEAEFSGRSSYERYRWMELVNSSRSSRVVDRGL